MSVEQNTVMNNTHHKSGVLTRLFRGVNLSTSSLLGGRSASDAATSRSLRRSSLAPRNDGRGAGVASFGPGRRFVAVVTALMLALPVMSGALGFNTPAFADDLTNTVPNEEAGGGPFYSGTINTGFVPNGYTTAAQYGPGYGPYTVPGVFQSQSTTSATSFAAGLPLGTIFIDQDKIAQTGGRTEVVSKDTAIIAGLGQIDGTNRMGYDGTQPGAIKMEPGKVNHLNGNLFAVTYEDAAILPDGTRADLVITYSNAQIVIDQRYLVAPDGTQYYEVTRVADTVFVSYTPRNVAVVPGETYDGYPVYKDVNNIKYYRKSVGGTNRYFRIHEVSTTPADPQPDSLTATTEKQLYDGKEYTVYTDGTKKYIQPDNQQYYHGAVSLAQGNAFSYGGTDTTNFNPNNTEQGNGVVPPEWAGAAEALVNDYTSSNYGGITFTNGNLKVPAAGLTMEATYQIVNKDGTPAAGTFVFAVCGVNLDRDPDVGGSNNVAKPLWYSYNTNFDGENGKDHSYFSEAMEITGGKKSDYVYVRPNIGVYDNPAMTTVKGRYFWPNVSLHDGNIKFIGNSINSPALGGDDKSYSAGFVTLADAATGFKVKATGHGSQSNSMNSLVFNSKPIWYRYTESTGKHGSIAVTSEGNFGGDLSDGGTVYKPVGTWDKGSGWDGVGTPSGIGEAATHVVTEGKTVTYTMTPDIGYKISKLWIGDVWDSNRNVTNYAEITFNSESVSSMKKGDTQSITTAAGHDGLLTYNEDGTYSLKFEYAEHDEAVHVEWEPTTADILVAKVWDDKDDKDGLRAAAYRDPATTPKVKLQWFVGGKWEDVPANKLPDWTSRPDPDVNPQVVPDGKDTSGKYLDGRYEINRDPNKDSTDPDVIKHPFTWEYLPVYSYDNNGVADRLITYRIVEVPDLTSSDYKDPEYFDGQSFTLDSSMTKSRDGFQQFYTDGTTKYVKKGDGKYYEVDAHENSGKNPAAPQPDPSSLTGVTANSYYTVDKGTPYQTIDVRNEHKPNEIYIEFTKNWNDAAIRAMATGNNEYARKNLKFTLHGTIPTDNSSTKPVDLNGDDTGNDIVVEISMGEADGKAEAIGRVEGHDVVTDGSTNYVLRNAGDGEQYYTYTANADGTYSYTVASPQPTAADLNPVTGDGTYKIDDYNFGALIENLPTHSEGKLITYTLTETDSADNKTLDGNGWIVTGGQLTPGYDSNGKLKNYTTQFVNTPEIDDTTSPLPVTIQKKDAVTKGSLEGAIFTVYTNAVSKEKASESATEEIGGKTVYTDGTTKYVLQDDGGEDKYFAVGTDGIVASTAADPQPNPANLFESKTTTTEKIDGQTVYTDGTTKYVLRSGVYYTYEDNGDGTYNYTKAANQNAGTMRQSQLKGAVDENEVVTNANGQVTINFNKPGTYYVVETKAPTGYEVDPKVYTFVVDEKLKSVTFKDVENPERDWWEVIYEMLFGSGTNTEANWDQAADNKGGTLTVENDPIRANILINKIWDDNNNQDGLRNTSDLPKVKLEKTTNPADETSWTAVNSQAVPAVDKVIPNHDAPITVDPDNYYTWGDLPAYENGKLIYYRVKEFGGTLPGGGVFLPTGDHPEDNGYAWTALTATGNEEKFNIANITDPANPTSRNRTVTVTNKHVPQTITLNVSKDWADDEDDAPDYKYRKTADITLYKTVNGAEFIVETRTGAVPLEDEKNFTVFENLPVYENGNLITYRVEETAINHYGTTYKRSYETNTAVVDGEEGDSIDPSTVKRTFGPEKIGDYPVYVDGSGNQYAYVTGEAGTTDGYYAVSGDTIDYDTSYAGDTSELTVTREETTEAEIEVKNAKLTEVLVEKTWYNGATENAIYYVYRTISTDTNITDWENAKGQGTASVLKDNKTVYNWNPDANWEQVLDEDGQPLAVAFPANLFENKTEAEGGSTKEYTIPNVPVADPDGNRYVYRVHELDSHTVEKFEANQVSNTKVENTNARAHDGIVHVNVVKELEGREWNNNDRFYFKIEPYRDGDKDSVDYGHAGAFGVDQNGDPITDATKVPLPKDSNNNSKDIQDVMKSSPQVGAIGRNVAFTPIRYTSADIDMGKSAEYYYKVYEVYDAQGTDLDEATEHTGKKAGIAYDGKVVSGEFKPTEHILKVTVNSDATGVITTALYWDGSEIPSAVPVYTNIYDAVAKVNAHIIKEVRGREIIGNDEFNFSITNIGGAPLRANENDDAIIEAGTHDAGSIEKNTGSKVTGTGAYNPVGGDSGSFRAIKSESTNWYKVGDLSQKTPDGRATDIFIYRIIENPEGTGATDSKANDGDLDFDSRHIYIKVVATDNLDGTIDIQKSYWYDEMCSSQPVGASVLVDSEGNIAPADATSDDEDGEGNKLYHYEPAAIFTNNQTIDIPVVKEWKGAPAVEDVTLRLQRKLIPLSAEAGLTYSDAESAAGYNNEGWKDVGNVTTAPRGDFFKDDGTPNYNALSPLTATKTYENVDGFNMNLPKYVTVGDTTYRAIYKLVEDKTSDAYNTTYRSEKDGEEDTPNNQIFIDGETLVVTNTVTASNEANIAAVKQLLGRQWLSDDDFSFTLKPAGKGTYKADGSFNTIDSSDDAKAAVPMPENNTDRQSETTGTGKDTVATTHAWDDANNANSIVVDQNGNLERLARFGAIKFDINDLTWVNNHYEGDFFYTVEEKVPDDAENAAGVKYSEATAAQKAAGGFVKDGITYDGTSHDVHVKVQGNRTNQLYVQIAYDEKTVGDASTGTQFTPVYTNRYDAVGTQNAQINKYIMGRGFTEGETFTFKITPLGDTPMVDAETGDRLDSREGTLTVSDTSKTVQSLTLPNIKFILDDLPWTVGVNGATDARDGTTGTLTYSDNTIPVAGMKYGRFMYAFTEKSASASDLTLDADTEYVQVTVIDKGDGTLDTQVKYFEDRYGTKPRFTPNADGTPSTTPATATVFVNKLKRDLSVTKAWDAPATSDVTLKLQWTTDNGETWNNADGTDWLADFPSTQTIKQAGNELTVKWEKLPAYAPDDDDIDLNDKWVRYRVVEDSIANVTTRYSTAAYANGDEATDAKYSETAIATEAEDADTRVTQTYVTNFVDDLEGTASVNVVKQLIGRGWTDSDSFGFTITPKESKIGTETTAKPASERAMPMPMGTDDNGDPVVDNTATATKTGSRPVTVGEYNATFEDIVIKLSDLALNDKNVATGEFVYTIKETVPDDATEITGTDGKKYYVKGDIKYTAEEHTVTIVATNDGTGTIDTTVSYDGRPAGDFVPVYTNEVIVTTPIEGSKTWVGGEASEHVNANSEGVDARGITLQRKTAADTDWEALTKDDAKRDLVVVWDNATGNSDYTVMAEKVTTDPDTGDETTENVDPVLDMMDNDGYKYEYRIVEGSVPTNYAVSYATTGVTNNDITNTSTKKDSLKVTKTWADENNAEGLRPDKVVMHLYKRVAGSNVQVEVASQEIAKNAETTGITWGDLPVYDAAGNKITYVVIEEAEYGYTTTYKVLGDSTIIDYTAAGNSLTLDGNTTAAPQTIDVKNTLTPATDTVSVTKTWDDINDSDDERPDEVTLKLYAYVWDKTVNDTNYEKTGKYVKNTTPVKTFVLDGEESDDTLNKLRELAPEDANTWKGEFYDLPRTKNGKTVLYVVEEDVSDTQEFGAPGTEGKYSNEPVITGNQVDGYTVANTYTPYTVSLKVTKNWNDAALQALAGKGYDRPESVAVKLTANKGGATYANVALSDNNTWTHTWTKLPRYAAVADEDGAVTYEPIIYTITEVAGDTPQGYAVTYKLNDTATANDGETAPGIDASQLGEPENYRAEVEVTNTPNVADKVEADIVLHKIDSVTGKNIAGVQFELKKGDTVKGTYTTDAQGVAHINFDEVFSGDDMQDTYEYTLTEKAPATGYEASDAVYTIEVSSEGVQSIELEHTGKNIFEKLYDLIVGGDDPDYNAATHTLTVKNTPTTNKVTVSKTFVDDEGNAIPESLLGSFEIKANYTGVKDDGTADPQAKTLKVTGGDITPTASADGKTYTWEITGVAYGTDVHVHETKYLNVTGYDFVSTAVTAPAGAQTHDDDASFTMPNVAATVGFTNTYAKQTGDLELVKNWSDDSNRDRARPTSVEFTVTASAPVFGTAAAPSTTKTVTLTGETTAGSWSDKTLTDLPLYHEGEKVTYTVGEAALPEGYSKAIGQTDGVTLTQDATETLSITNSYTPKTDSLTVKKMWDDDNDAAGLRPNSVTFHLYKTVSGGADVSAGVDAKTVNVTDNWMAKWENLPVYENGEKITYKVVEEAVAGYNTPTVTPETIPLDAENGAQEVIVTNKLTAETTSVSVTKNWNDNNNQDGLRAPATVTLRERVWDKTSGRYGTATDVDTGTLSVANDATVTFSGLPAIKNGKPVMYSVVEAQVPNYEAPVVTGNQVDGFTVTNTHKPAKGCVEVQKIWEDNNNQDGKRTNVTMTLKSTIGTDENANTIEVGSKVISADMNKPQEAEWHNLPVFRDGQRITYTVEETGADSAYRTTYSDDVQLANDGDTKTLIVTNEYTPATTTVTATKEWSDNNNQDGMRANVTLHLKGTIAGSDFVSMNFADKTVATGTNHDQNMAATWENLPVYHDGKAITYTVTEEALPGYTAAITGDATNGFTVTNSHPSAVTSVTVEKVWDDANNVDGKRTQVTVRLYKTVGDETTEVVPSVRTLATGTNHDQNMETTWTGLPAYENGEPVFYSVRENAIEGYTPRITGDQVNGFTITNTHQQDTATVTVNKTWVDDSATYRPDHVVYTLKADGGTATDVNGNVVSPATALGSDYGAVFTNLPKNKLDSEGTRTPIAYTVEETPLPGYTTTYANPVVDSAGNTTIAVTNTAKLGTLVVTKKWSDEDNRDGKRPSADDFKAKLSIYADGKQVTLNGTATDNGDNNTFTVAYTGVPVYNANNQPITYMVAEGSITDYTQTGTLLPTTELANITLVGAVQLTNTYEPEKIDVSFTKQWNDASNQDGERPTTSDFADMLALTSDSGDDVSAATPTVVDNGDNTFTITYSDLYKMWRDGDTSKDIVYTLTETLPNGSVYTADTDETTSEDGAAPLKNSYTPETTTVKVTKVWDDGNDQDGNRPPNVTVRLLADGTEVASAQITEGEFTFTKSGANNAGTELPKKKNGVDIVYTVTEDAVADYQQAITGDAASGYTIKNSYEPGTTTVTVTKVWDDADNQDGLRPPNVTITLLADDTEVASTQIAGGSYTFTTDSDGDPLPAKKNGTDIVYTVSEEQVPDYNAPVITGDATTGFTITNTHAPATTSASVTKIWADDNNADGLRPNSVTFQLYKTVANTTVAVPGKTITLTASNADANNANTWAGTIDNLPEKENGQAITYSFKEVDVPAGYSATSDDGLTITNTHERYTGCVEAIKIWADDNNREGKRTEVTFQLKADGENATYANGTAVPTETISANTSTPQAAAWHNLPVNNEAGEPIVYTVVESGADSDYEMKQTPVDGVTITKGGTAVIEVKNTYAPAPISVTATKVWNDNNNRDGMRADVTLHLRGTVAGSNLALTFDDKTIVKDATALDGEPAGTATWTGLPVYHDGKAITYTVTEEAIPGYTAAITGDATNGFTVTNSHPSAVTSVTVTKVWNDAENQDGLRANAIVHLDKTVDGTTTQNVELPEALAVGAGHNQGMTFTWENLPAYENGMPVFYSVREEAIAGYTPQITGDQENGFTITNVHPVETINIQATKVWNDAALMKDDGSPIEGYDRPKTVSLQLKADGTAVGAPVAVSKSSKVGNTEWAHQWTGLPKYKNGGTAIAYTVEELEVPDGYTAAVTGNMADGFTVTNTPDVAEILGADLLVKKVDKSTGKPMKDITFTLTSDSVEGFTSVIQTTNDGGVAAFTFDKIGTYTLTETVPTGYENPDPASYTITVSKEDSANTHVELVESEGRNVFQKIYDLLFNGGGANYNADTKTLTVKNTPKTSDVTVRKQFVDADTHAPIPPAAIPADFVIHADYTTLDENGVGEKQTDTLELSDAAYSDGTYRWVLEGVAYGTDVHVHEMKYLNVTGYDFVSTAVTASASGAQTHDDDASFTMPGEDVMVTFANSYTKQTGDLELVKNWSDDSNRDRARPQNVSFTVTASAPVFGTAEEPSTTKTVTLTGETTADSWSNKSLTGLPLYYNGEKVTYTVDETTVPTGYTKAIDQPTGVTLTKGATKTLSITNNHPLQTDSLTVTKAWTDSDDAAGLRPNSVTFHLYKTVSGGADVSAGVDAKPVSGAGSAIWTGLPVYDANGAKITYKVVEEAVPGYTATTVEPATIQLDGDTTADPQTVTVTNSLTPATTSVNVTKVWDDGNNVDGTRKAATVTLYKQEWDKDAGQYGDAVTTGQTKTLAVTDNAKASFENLTVNANGKPIIYSVRETRVEGYNEPVVAGDQKNGFTITNTHVPNTRTITVTKAWNDMGMTAANYQRPKDISVNLFANGTAVGQARGLSEGNSWSTSWTVPVNDANGAITYVVKELNTPTGYTYSGDVTVTGTGNQSVTITNTAKPDEKQNPLEITVRKTNLKGELLEGATFTLEGPNNYLANVTSDADGRFTLTFPKDGTYTLTETNAPTGYKVSDTPITIEVGKQLSEINLQTGSGLWASIYNLFVDTAPAGWDASSKTLTLTNEPLDYTINVRKYFRGISSADWPAGFAFELTYTDARGKTQVITNDSPYSFFADGSMFAFEHIPFDSEVTIRETGYQVTGKAVGTEITVNVPNTVTTSDSVSFTMPNDHPSVSFTNTYVDNTSVTIPVAKVWDDANNQDKKRPAEVTFRLFANGVDTGKTVTLSATDVDTENANRWAKANAFTVPTTDETDTPIAYTVREDVSRELATAGYTDSGEGTAANQYTIKNILTPTPGEILGDETWGGINEQQIGEINWNVNLNNPVTPGELVVPEDGTLNSDGTVTVTGGTYELNSGGTVTFTPKADWHGDPTPIMVKGTDRQGNTVTATYTPHVVNNIETDDVMRTITYSYVADGSQAADTVTQTVTFTRTGEVDPDTGEVTFKDDGSDWTVVGDNPDAANFAKVDSPDIEGYNPDRASVPAVTVKPGDDDITEKVVYSDQIVVNPYTMTVVKVDSITGDPLAGAEFTMSDPHGTVFPPKTTGEDGTVTFTLDAEGSWSLVETGVPENHKLGDVYSWTIVTKVDRNRVVKIEKVTEDANTLWQKFVNLFVDPIPEGYDEDTATLTVDNPPINEKTITYVDPNPEDASDVTKIQEDTIKVGENEPSQPTNPTRDGYIFGGWLRSMDSGSGNVTYTANWIRIPKPGEKEIKYVDPSKPEGQQTVLREVITRGDNEPEQPPNPTRGGYKFIGWKRTIDADGNVTYTATWEEIPPAERVTVTYNPNNGGASTTETINRNENEPEQPADPTRKGFKFVGWQRVEDKNGNVTYTARWEEIPESERIVITYEYGNGEDPTRTTIERGDNEPAQPGDPMRDGYEFSGWDRIVDADGNVTYKARWKKLELTDKVTITYDPANGKDSMSTTIERGDNEPGQPENPTREGYIFGGWLRTQDPETGNVTYTASWIDATMCPAPTPTPTTTPSDDPTSQTIWVTYVDPDGTVYMEKTTIAKGAEEPPAPADPTRGDYVFDGWDRTVDEDGNIVYTARWKKMSTPTPSGSPTPSYIPAPPTVSERPLPATPLSKTGGSVGAAGVTALMLAGFGGSLLARRRRQDMKAD